MIKLKNEQLPNTDDFDPVNQILIELKNKGNIKGVVFAERNGNLIAENVGKNFNGDTFAAMCATVLESAKDLKINLNSKKMNKIIIELESGKSIIIIECDEKTFLSFILKKDSNIDLLLNNLDDYCTNILSYYK